MAKKGEDLATRAAVRMAQHTTAYYTIPVELYMRMAWSLDGREEALS